MGFAANPVDVFVGFYHWVCWVNHDDFVPSGSPIASHPIGVQHFEIWESASRAFFRD
jgi:hypothetical protein